MINDGQYTNYSLNLMKRICRWFERNIL